jgi:phosphatidate cytidylyltransferase
VVSWLPASWRALTVVLAALGGVAAWELVRALYPRARPLSGVTAALVLAAGWLDERHWLTLWLAVLFLAVAASTFSGPGPDLGRRWLALAGTVVYLPLCLVLYGWVRRLDSGGNLAVFLYLTVATNDALAQITGQLIGRRPLAPRISPGKTVEGAVGGIVSAGLMGLALSPALGWGHALGAALGLAMGLAGLSGDLTASLWKRQLGLKDFSALLGAQGGVLDRFDGLFFAAPIFFLLQSLI